MPRTVDPTLRQMYERMNPNVCEFVEIAQPDVGQVLRRWTDQFSVNPPRLSETPAATTQQSPGGGMMLKGTLTNIASMYHDDAGGIITLDIPDTSRIIRGVGWTVAATLKPLRIRRFTAKVKSLGGIPGAAYLELQIYRMRGVPGRVINAATGAAGGQLVQYTPTPLLPQPCRIANPWTLPNQTVDAVFDLTAYQLDIEHRNVPAPSLAQVGEIPEYIFEIGLTDPQAASSHDYEWRFDTTEGAALVVAGIGTFSDRLWSRANPDDPASQWVATPAIGAFSSQVPCFKIDIETYPATSQEVYAITLPRVPSPGSTGRIVFVRENPVPAGDGAATLDIATAASTGPWTAVTHGDIVATKQLNYWLRSTMNASADGHRSPVIEALGVEFRTPVDVTAEVTVEAPAQDVNVPMLGSAIGEGKATVMRTGRRDYHDPASDLLTVSAATQLEVDHYLGSRHPSISRDKWLHLGRYIVTAAQPTPTSEVFSLISYLKVLERKIPKPAETVNQTLTVASGTTTSAVHFTTTLPGSTVGHEYDGLAYYFIVRSTAVAGLAPGIIVAVSTNPSTTELDVPAMAAALAIGDTIELHSGVYAQPKLSWANADPADVWYEIATVWAGIPPERIGRADVGRVGRAGLPPKLADRAPGDTATQDRLRVSRTITEQVSARDLMDQLSFIMGGATVEIGGQICYRQIYPALDPSGNLVIPPEEVAATFDVRDIATLDTPRGLESRVTTMTCTYGVDTALGNDAAKPSTVVFSDADALAWFTEQDLEDIGNSAVPDDIAAWCYNTADGGLYLASTLCRQTVRACSTGLRLWPWTAVDMHPDLIGGDRVVVMTDQYTDYDPSAGVSYRGLVAYTLVLVHVARNGREFRGFMLGLGTAQQVVGGSGTASVGSVGQPSIGSIAFDAAGNLLVSVNMGNPAGGGFRVAASAAGMPSDATVNAATYVPGTSATVNLGAGAPWPAGATIQIKAIAYASNDTAGARSIASTSQIKVAGGSSGNTFTSVSQGTPNLGANTVPLNWVWGGAAATFNVWVSEFGNAFAEAFSGVSGASVTYTSAADLVAGPNSHPDHIKFYVEAIIGGSVIATSGVSDVIYFYQP